MMHEENFCCSRDPVHRDSSRGLYISAACTCSHTYTDTGTDTVPTTPQLRTCYAIVADDPQFSVLGAALKASKLDAALNGNGSFTILAPNDAAFAKLPNGTVASLLKEPEGQLKQILLNHVVANKTLLAVDVVKAW